MVYWALIWLALNSIPWVLVLLSAECYNVIIDWVGDVTSEVLWGILGEWICWVGAENWLLKTVIKTKVALFYSILFYFILFNKSFKSAQLNNCTVERKYKLKLFNIWNEFKRSWWNWIFKESKIFLKRVLKSSLYIYEIYCGDTTHYNCIVKKCFLAVRLTL